MGLGRPRGAPPRHCHNRAASSGRAAAIAAARLPLQRLSPIRVPTSYMLYHAISLIRSNDHPTTCRLELRFYVEERSLVAHRRYSMGPLGTRPDIHDHHSGLLSHLASVSSYTVSVQWRTVAKQRALKDHDVDDGQARGGQGPCVMALSGMLGDLIHSPPFRAV